jgi:acetyl esterase/lipase
VIAARALVAILAIGALAACSPRRVAESLLTGDHFTRVEDVAYGGDARQRLDVYRPRGARSGAPVVVFLHGGRWKYGSKDDYRLVGSALTRRGFVVVVPDARLAPAARFPAWIEDGARAVRWTTDHVAAHGGDPARVTLVGHSSGAHSVALLVLDARWLRAAGVPAGAVRGGVSLAGPVDTVWTDPDVQAAMGPREGWPATYPRTHVDGAAPPLLLLHGDADGVVFPSGSRRLAARVAAAGGCAPLRTYAGVGHVGIAVALATPGLGIAPVLDDVAAFARDAGTACAAAGGPGGAGVPSAASASRSRCWFRC